MELKNYIAIIKRRKLVIFITVATTMLITIIGTYLMTPTYTATTTLRVSTAASESLDYSAYMYAGRLMNTYAFLISSSPALDELQQTLNLSEPPKINVEVLPETELLQIEVEHEDRAVANSAALQLASILMAQNREVPTGGGLSSQEVLGDQLAQVEEELIQARMEHSNLVSQSPKDAEAIAASDLSISLKEETYGTLLRQYEQARIREALRANAISVVEPAEFPTAPSSPNWFLNIALGFVVGLAGGVGLAFLLENLDTTLYESEQIEAVTNLPLLASIPNKGKQEQKTSEAFDRLRTTLFASNPNGNSRVLLVTSAETGEGKSTIVANLALSIARDNRKVISLDCNLREPSLHEVFKLSNDMGLSNILNQKVPLERAITKHDSGTWVISSGPQPPNPSELLDSPRMSVLVDELKQFFDIVLLDTPAVMAAPDAAVLAQYADSVLLVVGCTRAREEALRTVCKELSSVNANNGGLVINEV